MSSSPSYSHSDVLSNAAISSFKVANCATEPADAEAELAALDAAALADALEAAALAELPDEALTEDEACDEPQAQSPSASTAANATTANTFLFMVLSLSPFALKALAFPFSKRAGYSTVNVPSIWPA